MTRIQVPPTGRERVMRDDDFIVSKTDQKGAITYGNPTFMEFSGYAESELLSQPHNIIRHPDMPRSIFRLLWRHLQSNCEFFGYVKNLSKDGSHYWTFANVTPSVNEIGQLVGYFSVRRKPSREAISVVEPIYQALSETEQRVGGKVGMEAAMTQLEQMVEERGGSYDDFVLSL